MKFVNTCADKIIAFDNSGQTGVLSSQGKTNSCVLLLNAGMLHKAGPFGLYTQIARQIAAQAIDCVRFDHPGLGDNDRKFTKQSYAQLLENNTLEIIAYLKHAGYERIYLIGLCTGADLAFRVALRSDQINGIVLMDGYAYPTFKNLFRKYKKYLVAPWRLLRPLMLKVTFRDSGITRSEAELSDYFWVMPKKPWFIAGIKNLVAKRVSMLSIYSYGALDYYNYHGQLQDCMRLPVTGKFVTEIYNKQADHTYSLRTDREMLCRQVVDWLKKTDDERLQKQV